MEMCYFKIKQEINELKKNKRKESFTATLRDQRSKMNLCHLGGKKGSALFSLVTPWCQSVFIPLLMIEDHKVINKHFDGGTCCWPSPSWVTVATEYRDCSHSHDDAAIVEMGTANVFYSDADYWTWLCITRFPFVAPNHLLPIIP